MHTHVCVYLIMTTVKIVLACWNMAMLMYWVMEVRYAAAA